MKDYIIVELNNGKKYVVVDMLEYQLHKYFLLSSVSNNETDISSQFDIRLYNEVSNKFELIKDEIVYNYIKSLFEKRIEEYSNKETGFASVSNMKFIKLKIVDIDSYDYTLEKVNGERLVKNIEIYGNLKLKVNDYMYMLEETVLEDNLFQFGPLINSNTEIIKIVSDNNDYYLQRYYG